MNYTKGPWEKVITARFGPDDFEGLNIESPNENTVICELAGGLPLIEIESNAHLIASAPDLLEACKTTRNHIFNGHSSPHTTNQILNILNKAIAKAEGRE